MPTLEERRNETIDVLESRLRDRSHEFDISMEFARYIESMEVYILELERRMEVLEAPGSDGRNIISLKQRGVRKLNAS